MTSNHRPIDPRELEEARLTAYALGQLDEAGRAAVERVLAASPEVQKTVDDLRALAARVAEARREQPCPKPSPALRAAVENRLNAWQEKPMTTTEASPVSRSPWYRRPWLAAAAAACLLAAGMAFYVAVVRGPHDRRALALSAQDRAAPESTSSLPAERTERIAQLRDSRSQDRSVWEYTATGRQGQSAQPTQLGHHVSASPSAAQVDSSRPSSREKHTPVPYQAAKDKKMLAVGVKSDAATPGSVRYGGDRQPTDGASTTASVVDEWLVAGRKQPVVLEDVEMSVAPPTGATRLLAIDSTGSTAPLGTAFAAEGRQLVTTTGRDGTITLWDLRGDKPADVYRIAQPGVPGTEQYETIVENDFLPAASRPLSTFSIDVDTASYANVRRFLNEDRLPPPGAVRIEEMVNYFPYDYRPPEGDQPFAVHVEVAQCPWNVRHRLVRIGLKGREIERDKRGPSNLVFLLDVSGSMRDENKLPLVKQAMRLLVEQLGEDDRVAIVTYAGEAGLKLESTCGDQKPTILQAIDSLSAGGSTHGSAGIQLAYEQAARHFVEGGTNRVLLATDGDLNVGITDDDQLVELIKKKAEDGVFLTVLGFGTGNLKDAKLEKLADHGNGVYAYVDNLREARKVLVEQMTGSLVTIAKDVKIQIEFNPAEVQSYRLIGYENRLLAAKDFDDDKKDAGEIGAGHTATALYELVPAGQDDAPATEARIELRYQRAAENAAAELTDEARSGELLTLRLRYKEPDDAGVKGTGTSAALRSQSPLRGARVKGTGTSAALRSQSPSSKLLERAVKDSGRRFGEASPDFQFAAAVASFGMILRNSKHRGDATLGAVEEYAVSGLGSDPGGYRAEFVDLVRRARSIDP